MPIIELAATAIATGKSVLDLAKEIGAKVKEADKTEEVTKQSSLYLESAETAVAALGLERQRILTDLRKLDLGKPEQVSAAWERLGKYLHEDNIRPFLKKSIGGLIGCRTAIERQAKGLRWRKRDKQAAVREFCATLCELERTLDKLSSNFYPGEGSGMGVKTLRPIYALLDKVRKDKGSKKSTSADLESSNEHLADLVRQALHDPSHDEWVHSTGKIEKLVSELQLAFR